MFDLKTLVLGAIVLSLTLTLPAMLFYPVEVKTSDYTDPEVCSGCHAGIYSQWNGSMHSNAQKDPVYQKLFLMASRETNGTFDTFCTKCHAPIAYLSGEIPSADNYNVSEIAGKGISCDFCHMVNASRGIGNGAFVSSPTRIKRGPFNNSYSAYHEVAYSELHTSAEFCGMCHNAVHPSNGLVLSSTYTEWKEGPYNETTPCQHCHMTPGVTKFKQNPGMAGESAPMNENIRDNVYTHYFVGGNAMVPEMLGSPEYERLAKERLRSAAKLDIESIERVNGTVNLKIRVTNTGAGHRIPTGLTEARMIWLDVDVRDNAGNQIFRSGEMDNGGYIRGNATIYHTVLGDPEGNPTRKIWLADRVLFDNRIPPKGHSIENYSFTVPKNTKGPLNIKIKLNYVSASQEFMDLVFGKGEIKPPVVEMASINTTVEPFSDTKKMPGFPSASLIIVILLSYAGIKLNRQ